MWQTGRSLYRSSWLLLAGTKGSRNRRTNRLQVCDAKGWLNEENRGRKSGRKSSRIKGSENIFQDDGQRPIKATRREADESGTSKTCETIGKHAKMITQKSVLEKKFQKSLRKKLPDRGATAETESGKAKEQQREQKQGRKMDTI